MMRTGVAITFLALAVSAAGGVAEDHGQLVPEARTALSRAVRYFHDEISCHGGYLWRYKQDLNDREGEGKATETQIWVQPPGTPSVGLALLEAYEATNSAYFLECAQDAANALEWGQLACGGWDYKIDFDDEASKRWYYRREWSPFEAAVVYNSFGQRTVESNPVDPKARLEAKDGKRNQCTFDDNNTQHALRLLIAVDRATGFVPTGQPFGPPQTPLLSKIPIIGRLFERGRTKATGLPLPSSHPTLYGLRSMLDAQFPNGAWPQRWPLSESGYSRFYTFNDNSINDCITVMLEAYTTYGHEGYLESAKKGGDFIILSQQPKPQAGWAQQYDEEMKPAPARWFEPAAVNGAVTPRNMTTLMTLFRATKDEKYLQPIPAAIDWLKASQLENGKWARFYEPGTNKPLYVTKDREVVYVYGDTIRPGYSWESEYGIPRVIEQYEALKREIEAGTVQWTIPPAEPSQPSVQELHASMDRLAPEVRKVIDALDDQGRWVRGDGWIYCSDFSRNVAMLSRYLGAARALKSVEQEGQ